ncbi:MAG: TetR/AcrR family transcriptional regulator [Desulfobacter sp.]|nr:TetR/AcrR family transcriptional regulator [Desulfobacter sp.]
MDEAKFFKKKEQIIDIAAEIIMEDGYQTLSMRKIGSKIGMTAANIYNYYSNKDELNIAIRARAGMILFDALENAYQKGGAISEKICFMIEAYARFGIVKANYYSILFDMQTPKFADYVASPLEKLALKEKESTEKSLALLQKCIRNLQEEGYCLPENTDPFLVMIWGQVHGLVSLYNNKLISEINTTPEKTLQEATGLIHEILFRFIKKPEH